MNKSSVRSALPVAAAALFFAGLLALSAARGLSALALPFTLLGAMLREMSLSGTAGNIVAFALYILLALLPLTLKLRGKWAKEDLLLPLGSALLLYVLYYMVNPTLRPMILQNHVGDLILSGVIYSTLLSWSIIKLVRRCDGMHSDTLYRTLRIFLTAGAALLLWVIAVEFNGCFAKIAAIKAANTAPEIDLTATIVFVFLSFAVSALEYGLCAVLLVHTSKFLKVLAHDAYNEKCARAAQNLSLLCRYSLVCTTLSGLALQIAQLLFSPLLHDLSVSFRLPVVGVVISFALLALSRLLSQGSHLKQDNDLFI